DFTPPAGFAAGSGVPSNGAPNAAADSGVPASDGGQATARPGNGAGPGGSAFGGGATGVLRLFKGDVAGQTSWLAPLAMIGGVVALLSVGRRLRGNTKLGGLIVWGGWLLTTGAVFSEAKGIFHPYYLSFLAPAVAAMAGIGLVSLARSFRTGNRALAWIAPVAIVATAIFEVTVLRRTPSYHPWLVPAILACAGAS